MNNQILTELPTFIICPFCHQQIEGSYVKETSVQYNCTNHLPLRIIYYYYRKTHGEWYWGSMSIFIPKHFQLYWNPRGTEGFQLVEWHKMDYNLNGGGWKFNSQLTKTFSPEWVFSQSAEKLLSLLNMYKTFS